MAINKIAPVVSVATLVLLAACGQPEAEAPATEAAVTEAPVTQTAEVVSGLPKTASAPGASVFFVTPADGATVSSPVTIEFGIEGMSVAPAGVNDAHSGHHHLLIDTGLPELDMPVPADANHIHFGDGSTSTQLILDPGEHTLQLLLADYLHIPHEPPVTSATITITVE